MPPAPRTTAGSERKAYLEIEPGEKFRCLFNPAELALTKSNQWTADFVPGRSVPGLFFTGGGSGSMTLNLTFDTTARGTSVTIYTNKLLDAMAVNRDLADFDRSRNKGRPPWVRFHWGSLHSWKAVIEQLGLTFTYFSSTGMPLRAKAALTLKQFDEDEDWGRQNPTSGTPEPHRAHRLRVGETLHDLAARYFGDPMLWRAIATANEIDDPLSVEPGRLLAVPVSPPEVIAGGRMSSQERAMTPGVDGEGRRD